MKTPARTFISSLLVTLLTSISIRAADRSDSNGHLWLNYVGDHPIRNGPWGVHLESQVRRADFGGSWQQLLIRPGINYTFYNN